MKLTIEKEMHKSQVGMQIFCPVCQKVLDHTQAVSLDVMQNEKLLYHKVFCVVCWDTKVSKEKLQTTKDKIEATVSWFDGRTNTREEL